MTRTIEDVESDLDSCRADLEDLPARIARAERLVQMYQDDLDRLHRDLAEAIDLIPVFEKELEDMESNARGMR